MKAIRRELDEIERLKCAIEKTNSEHLRRDYQKAIKRKTKEIKEYCRYRGIDYENIS